LLRVTTIVVLLAVPQAGLVEAQGISHEGSVASRNEWREYLFSGSRTGWNSYETQISPSNVGSLQLAWKDPTSDVVGGPPAVVDGVVYGASYDGFVHAWEVRTGKELWSSALSEQRDPFAPSVAHGMVYVGDSSGGSVYALNARTGTIVWSVDVGGVEWAPLVEGNVVYVASGLGGYAYAFDAYTGEQLWKTYTTDAASAPTYSRGTVYLETLTQPSLLAIDARTGSILWGIGIINFCGMAPIVSDDTVYFCSQGTEFGSSNLRAVDARTGRARWRVRNPAELFVQPTLTSGILYIAGLPFGGSSSTVYAIDADTGARLWTSRLDEMRLGAISGANGVLYSVTDGGLVALSASDGTELWSYTTGSSSFGVVVVEGMVFCGSFDKNMYAFKLPVLRPTQ